MQILPEILKVSVPSKPESKPRELDLKDVCLKASPVSVDEQAASCESAYVPNNWRFQSACRPYTGMTSIGPQIHGKADHFISRRYNHHEDTEDKMC